MVCRRYVYVWVCCVFLLNPDFAKNAKIPTTSPARSRGVTAGWESSWVRRLYPGAAGACFPVWCMALFNALVRTLLRMLTAVLSVVCVCVRVCLCVCVCVRVFVWQHHAGSTYGKMTRSTKEEDFNVYEPPSLLPEAPHQGGQGSSAAHGHAGGKIPGYTGFVKNTSEAIGLSYGKMTQTPRN